MKFPSSSVTVPPQSNVLIFALIPLFIMTMMITTGIGTTSLLFKLGIVKRFQHKRRGGIRHYKVSAKKVRGDCSPPSIEEISSVEQDTSSYQ